MFPKPGDTDELGKERSWERIIAHCVYMLQLARKCAAGLLSGYNTLVTSYVFRTQVKGNSGLACFNVWSTVVRAGPVHDLVDKVANEAPLKQVDTPSVPLLFCHALGVLLVHHL